MKYLGLWSPELRNYFWKICKTPSYILNVRSLNCIWQTNVNFPKILDPEKHSVESAKKGLARKVVPDSATKIHIFVISKEWGFQKCIVYPSYFRVKQTCLFSEIEKLAPWLFLLIGKIIPSIFRILNSKNSRAIYL